MANIDVSFLLSDPDFAELAGAATVTLIKTVQTLNGYGEQQLTENATTITAVIQTAGQEELSFLPEGAYLTNYITVYYQGELTAQNLNGYADFIEWNGYRYQVKMVTENYLNYGNGFTKAICERVTINKNVQQY